jgi:glutamate/tyrosine decarboxylase-like PLP-dependent enzyme
MSLRSISAQGVQDNGAWHDEVRAHQLPLDALLFFGCAIGRPLPAALAANWMATAWEQNSAPYNAVPGTAILKQIALGWLLNAPQLPPESGGAFVTGTTVTCAPAGRLRYLRRYGFPARQSAPPTQ